MPEIVNPIKSTKQKQGDKFILELRLGKLTILELSYDISEKEFRFEILNLAIKSKKKKINK